MIALSRTILSWLVVMLMMAVTSLIGCAERGVDSDAVNGITRDEAVALLATIKGSVDSAAEFSKLVRYPMYAYEDGKDEKIIRDETDFAEIFPSVFTGDFVASVKRFDSRELWSNSYGFMICNGQLWFAKITVPATGVRETFVTVIQPTSAKIRVTFFRKEP